MVDRSGGPLAGEGGEHSLATMVLDLPDPEYHGDVSGYHDDAARDYAPTIVGLLGQLNSAGVDRSGSPVIGTYLSRSTGEGHEIVFERGIATAVLDHARAEGLRVEVEVAGEGTFADPVEQEVPKPEPRNLILRGVHWAAKWFRGDSDPVQATGPDFRLRIEHSEPVGDSLLPTHDPWKGRLTHQISIVYPDA